jgi:hypothetical protein
MLILFWLKSRDMCRNLRRGMAKAGNQSLSGIVSTRLERIVMSVSFRATGLRMQEKNDRFALT